MNLLASSGSCNLDASSKTIFWCEATSSDHLCQSECPKEELASWEPIAPRNPFFSRVPIFAYPFIRLYILLSCSQVCEEKWVTNEAGEQVLEGKYNCQNSTWPECRIVEFPVSIAVPR